MLTTDHINNIFSSALLIVLLLSGDVLVNFSFASDACDGVIRFSKVSDMTGNLGGKTSSSLFILNHIVENSEKACGYMHPHTAKAYLDLAREELKYEHYDKAEKLVISALQVFSKSIGRSRFYHADALALLAMIRSSVGDFKTARYATDKSFSIRQHAWGKSDARLVDNYIVSSRIAFSENKKDLAIQLAQNAYQILPSKKPRKFSVGNRSVRKYNEQHLMLVEALANLYLSNNDLKTAEKTVSRIANKVVNLPNVRFQPLVGDILNTSARTALSLGHKEIALKRINRALNIYDEGYSTSTSKYARALVLKARIISALHSKQITNNTEQEIMSLLDIAVIILDNEAKNIVFTSPLIAAKNRLDIRKAATDLVHTADYLSSSHNTTQSLMTKYGLRMAQLLNSTEAARSITKANLRRSLTSKELQSLVKKYQNLLNKEQDLRGQFIEAKFIEDKKDITHANKVKLVSISKEINKLRNDINKSHPDNFNDIRLHSSDSVELQNTLLPKEALLLYLVDKNTTHLWIINNNSTTYKKINVSEAKLKDRILRLRKSTRFKQEKEGVSTRNFSTVSAYKLYEWLIMPAESSLKATDDLLIIPSGPLFSLPFAALITNKEDQLKFGFDDLPNVHWLITRYSITTLPVISTLNKRNQVGMFDNNSRFIGFGDPLLTIPDTTHASTLDTIRSLNKKSRFNQLSPLPDTLTELKNISKVFGDNNSIVYTQKEATETNLYKADLEEVDIISFATHGLLSGIGNSSDEAALILTPIDFSNNDTDGLLTASEISSLNINAKLVILSACDTAVNGKLNSEGISELASAFYFAGGKSILASHWPVESKTTSELISNLMKKSFEMKTPRLNQALRLTMLDMINNTENKYRSHPAYWAAFSLFGS